MKTLLVLVILFTSAAAFADETCETSWVTNPDGTSGSQVVCYDNDTGGSTTPGSGGGGCHQIFVQNSKGGCWTQVCN